MILVEKMHKTLPGESCEKSVALESTPWQLTEVEGKKPVGEAPSLMFETKEGRVTGSTGCNRLFGSFTHSENQLKFSRIASTRRACEKGMETEAAFLRALNEVHSYRITGGTLELLDAGGKVLARFVPQNPIRSGAPRSGPAVTP